ncbi:MAG: phosphatidylserine/phosphatidylglycerophosphate/cardiolipin synthase family protein [Gemmatimonadota bacterium]
MSELLGSGLPWWGWMLLGVGVISIVAVFAALFLPDWHQPERLETPLESPADSEAFLHGVAAHLNVPVARGGEATLLQNGDEFFPAMLEAIRSARETVNFQVYIFEPEGIGREFLQAFEERARAGVEVRLMVDAFGSHKLDEETRRSLTAAGCRVTRFRPIRLTTLVRAFKRDHRRAIVVDGRVGFTGGGAIADKWTGNAQDEHHWRDSMTRFEGPLATCVQAAFVENWIYGTGEVLTGPRFFPYAGGAPGSRVQASAPSSSPAPDRGGAELPAAFGVVSSPSDAAQPIRTLYWLSFQAARRRIMISSSYFVPGRRVREAVMERARAGVEARILVPGPNTDAKPVRLAGRTLYGELLEAGVRIFEYEPTMMHAKTVVIDGTWCIVGSSNMDERSTELNEENNVAVRDARLAAQIESGLLADMEQAREIRLEEWLRRSRVERVQERLALALIQQY